MELQKGKMMKHTIDWTKPVRTKSGLPVEIISTKGRGVGCVVGFIGVEEDPRRWRIFGEIDVDAKLRVYLDRANDLENVPEPIKTREFWVNVIELSDGSLTMYGAHDDRQGAIDCTTDAPIKIIGRHKITLRAEFED